MKPNTVTGICISCILAVIIILYFLSFRLIPKEIIFLLLIILQIISIFFIFYNDGTEGETEPFHFEVSPQKKKCLVEQVSLQQPPAVRSPECCNVTTVGGKLPYIEEWKNNDNPVNWARTDNWTTSKENNAYATQLAPTTFIE